MILRRFYGFGGFLYGLYKIIVLRAFFNRSGFLGFGFRFRGFLWGFRGVFYRFYWGSGVFCCIPVKNRGFYRFGFGGSFCRNVRNKKKKKKPLKLIKGFLKPIKTKNFAAFILFYFLIRINLLSSYDRNRIF